MIKIMREGYTLCLNMIVKDESHIIEKTLTNLCSKIKFDYWVISDTGSTDNTQNIIKNFFEEKGIEGELFEDEWKNFGHNRTVALKHAYNKTDYLLIFDADDEIVGEFTLKINGKIDVYKLCFGKDFKYFRPLLINNRMKWIFRCVLHEFLVVPYGRISEEFDDGNYYIISGKSGNRSKNPNKYLDDAKLLEKEFYIEKESSIKYRYAFYCAQSYENHGDVDKAIEWYEKCLTLGNWSQEKYISCFVLGQLYSKKSDIKNMIKYYLETLKYDNERIEGVAELMKYFYDNNLHYLVNAVYHKCKNYSKIENIISSNKLFLRTYYWKNLIEYYSSISSYYVLGEMKTGYECCKIILKEKLIDINKINATIKNLIFYLSEFQSDDSKLNVFNDVQDLIANHKSLHNDDDVLNVFNKLFEICVQNS